MELTAFIPARGGSKGVPRKNLVLLGGKPLIQHTIEAAATARTVDRIFVTSDDREILDFCRELGVDTGYVRPKELAEDETSMVDTIEHALYWLA